MAPAAPPARAPADSVATIAAIGLVAYVSADVAHHAFGHGAACLGLGCRLESVPSVFVQCSCTGATVDLASPLANLLLGVGALGTVRFRPRAAASVRLLLTAAFNLFYFAGQLAPPAVSCPGSPPVRLGSGGQHCLFSDHAPVGRATRPFCLAPCPAHDLVGLRLGHRRTDCVRNGGP